ncbi:MAG: metallophosphoesterase family protein [bacterium]
MKNLHHLAGPVVVFGGPYSNFQATQAMLNEADRLGIPPTNVICNGDLVAYCADPEDTVNLIKDWGINVVKGNCEESIGDQADDCGCGFTEDSLCSLLSAEWYNYSKTKISKTNQIWMSRLPEMIKFNIGPTSFAVIHGGVQDISEFVFASSATDQKCKDISAMAVDCIIGGHCGIPFGHQVKSGFWLNTGVIGMPANDGTRDGWYMLLQPDETGVVSSWHRLPFDATSAAESMRLAGLGDSYRKALLTGLWPSMDILPHTEQSKRGEPLQLPLLRLA